MGKASIKKIIVDRVIALYLGLFLMALVVLFRILQLQILQGDELRQKAEDLMLKYVTIEPNRGDIYATGGKRLLATSVPYYEIRMDLKSNALKNEDFNQGVDSLSYRLSRIFRDKSKAAWKRDLTRAREAGKRYYLIRRQVSYQHLQEMKTFPIFRLGRYKGGFIPIQSNRRVLPHQMLAARTIGYLSKSESGNIVGLEGAYDHYLGGVKGIRLMQKTAGNIWIPVNDANEVEPENGYDLVTTIDVDIQDVAENALLKQLSLHEAHHGCAILMEVETGDIRAIANLSRNKNGHYTESYNYAIAESTEPGSTFKLAVLMVALEDGFIELDDTIDTGKGSVRYYDKVIRDNRRGGYGIITVKEAFELSSNVALSRIINDNYRGKEEAFVERLYRMHLNESLGIEIRGEGEPLIRYPGDDYWSGITLPMMSHGYEVRMTPLQILTFYNAVANDGKMVKPRIAESIHHYGRTIKRFNTRVIDPSICSDETLEKVKIMLEGVVENGTAKNLSNENFRIAGKTGTAQIANAKYGYRVDSRVSYQASFVGYFPAEKPKYSCIVVVNSPTSDVYYGNLVAGPVFQEISRKVYATSLDLQQDLQSKDGFLAEIPYSKNGYRIELEKVLKDLDIPLSGETGSDWVQSTKTDDCIQTDPLSVLENLVPNVKEMGVKDAVFLLENVGLKVIIHGRGKVLKQSITPGSRIEKGQRIVLTMSFT
ncbi:MAG: transpeptidase family protein [Bacteroidales bacterium]|nr:transpeptidase family protein [Bacteroidales bacterium]